MCNMHMCSAHLDLTLHRKLQAVLRHAGAVVAPPPLGHPKVEEVGGVDARQPAAGQQGSKAAARVGHASGCLRQGSKSQKRQDSRTKPAAVTSMCPGNVFGGPNVDNRPGQPSPGGTHHGMQVQADVAHALCHPQASSVKPNDIQQRQLAGPHRQGASTTESRSRLKISPCPRLRNSLYSSGDTRVCSKHDAIRTHNTMQ